MPKNKSHKGLLKRIRITKSGKVKVGRAGARHLKSHKTGSTVRQYRKSKYAVAAEAGRIGAMLNCHVRSEEASQRDKADAESKVEEAPVKKKKTTSKKTSKKSDKE